MKQSSLGLSHTTKRTRKREFLDAMELVVPWTELVSLIEPYAPESGRRGQQPFAVQILMKATAGREIRLPIRVVIAITVSLSPPTLTAVFQAAFMAAAARMAIKTSLVMASIWPQSCFPA